MIDYLLFSFLSWHRTFSKYEYAGSKSDEPMPNKGIRPRKMGAAKGSIAVNAPVATVYKRWLAFEDYPEFLTAIKRMRKLDANHFVILFVFGGKPYEATLEITLRVPKRRLAWRTISNDHARHQLTAAVVSFASLSDHGTRVTLKLTSRFGGVLSNRVNRYLRNFKQMAEKTVPNRKNSD